MGSAVSVVVTAAAAGVTGVKAAAATSFRSKFLSMCAVAASAVGTGLGLTRSNVRHHHFSAELFIVDPTLRVLPPPHWTVLVPWQTRDRFRVASLLNHSGSSLVQRKSSGRGIKASFRPASFLTSRVQRR